MKKGIVIAIYLAGVFVGWNMGLNHMRHLNKKYNTKITNGDLCAVTALSVFSWCDVGALCLVRLNDLEWWRKESECVK